MTLAQADPSTRKPLRLWPGVVAAALLLLATLVAVVVPDAFLGGMLGALVASLAIVVWWALFSRAPWLERLGAFLVMAVAVAAAPPLLDPSIAQAGRGRLFYMLAVPVLSLGLVVWAVAARRLVGRGPRWASMVATILLACGAFTLVRTSGVGGASPVNLHWRWTPTPEELLLAREPVALPPVPKTAATPAPAAGENPPERPLLPAAKSFEPPPVARTASEPAAVPPVAAAIETRAAWPGFRGRDRDAVVRGVQIKTDWTASPPVELWRRPVGPGWSSFAVQGDRLYTQEQRGDDEIVACYDARTGEPVWRHRDAARFWESNGGPGPRATPTLAGGRVYTLGATGIVNALDAGDGAVVWSRNAATDTGATPPYWGFAGSPLVLGDAVVVAASGRLVAYDVATGNPSWFGPTDRGGGYSSPHLATIDGVAQIVLLSGAGATGVSLADGTSLWRHDWAGGAIVQPALAPGADLLISSSDTMGGVGTRRLAIARGTGGWKVEERWTSTGLKPYFNDYVVHEGHAFGFDGHILACIDLADGKRKWKGGRYGQGQLVLLPEQDLLLVLSEEGELALVSATPDEFKERARFKAIEGKTWNHPALVGDVLLVRNGEEMAAFRLALAESRLSSRP